MLCGIVRTAYADSAGTEGASSPEDLLVHYTFNETAGTKAADNGLHGNDGVLTGGASWSSEGKAGGAVDLNGSTGYVKLPSGIMAEQSDITIATWVKADTLGTWARLFDFN